MSTPNNEVEMLSRDGTADPPPMDIMDIADDIDENEETGIFNDNLPRSSRKSMSKLTVLALTILALVLAIIVGVAYSKSTKVSAPASTLSNDFTTSGGSIIEFTVANLNTNRQKCTYIQSASRLECVPNHDESTNKFRIVLHPEWSPIGVEHFKELTRAEFWNNVRIFRIVPGFVSQFGLSSDPSTQRQWSKQIEDDEVVGSNVRGTVTFATAGANTRSTQIFINTGNNEFLDKQGFSPIGEVLDAGDSYGGMEVVDEFYSGYGEKPDQGLIRSDGIGYLDEQFPLLSFIVSAEYIEV
jgi:peptidyl-prolyl cis-trans isomerase A (cyclophilin A)